MKLKIDLRPVLTDPLHWFRIVIYVALVAVLAGPLQVALQKRAARGGWPAIWNAVLPPAAPPLIAAGIEVEEAMAKFAGYGSRGVWRATITATMMSMVCAYLVGPTLLIWGMRAHARYRLRDPGAPRAWVIAVALTLGGFSLVSLLTSAGIAYVAQESYTRMLGERVEADARNRLTDELLLMARKAQVAYFVAGEPWELAGSWQLSDGSKQPALSVAQLIEPGVDALIPDSRHAVIDGRTYELTVERADSVTIRGILPPLCQTITLDDGSTLPLEYRVGVTPQTVTMQLQP
jgi:hypothetical protein